MFGAPNKSRITCKQAHNPAHNPTSSNQRPYNNGSVSEESRGRAHVAGRRCVHPRLATLGVSSSCKLREHMCNTNVDRTSATSHSLCIFPACWRTATGHRVTHRDPDRMTSCHFWATRVLGNHRDRAHLDSSSSICIRTTPPMYTLCVSPFSLLILEFEDGFPDEDVSGTVMVGVWRASSDNGPVWGTVDGTCEQRRNQRLPVHSLFGLSVCGSRK